MADCLAAKDLVFLCSLSAAGLILGLRGILHYGYMGQDFYLHRLLLLTFPGGYSYKETDPPGLYWFGSLFLRHVSSTHYSEFIALAFLLLNSLALWIVYLFLWASLRQRQLRYSAAALVTLVPFRVIHSVVFASDAFTLPVFAVAVFFMVRILREPRNIFSWTGIALSVSAGMFFKYTVAGLLPPIALLSGVAIWGISPAGSRVRWGAIGTAALALPTAVFVFQMRECAKARGDLAVGQWLPEGAPSVMRWKDILELKKSDLGLLSAPDYFGGGLYGFRRYSYPGLVHVSSFTDVLNYFQPPPETVPTSWGKRADRPMARERSLISQFLQVASVRLCLVYSALAVAGTLLLTVLCSLSLLLRKPVLADATVAMTALAIGFYSVVFFSLHRLSDPYTPGFWLPRLVLPALLVFLCLGFVALELAHRHTARCRILFKWLINALALYTLAACLIFAGFLF
ncbi:MAG: hypothetical protein ABSH26_07800 [Opitutaceae bacterium]|jgi:hypothetical protein